MYKKHFKFKVLLFSTSTESHEILSIKFSREGETLKMTRRQRVKNNITDSTGFKTV